MDLQPVLTIEELAEVARDARPRTPDDVSITTDGRRLDSREKILAFVEELQMIRDREQDRTNV